MIFTEAEEAEILRVSNLMQEEAIEDAKKYPEARQRFHDRADIWLRISDKVREECRTMGAA